MAQLQLCRQILEPQKVPAQRIPKQEARRKQKEDEKEKEKEKRREVREGKRCWEAKKARDRNMECERKNMERVRKRTKTGGEKKSTERMIWN